MRQQIARLCLVLTPALWSAGAWGWEEQQVLEYIAAHNPVLRAQRVVTDEFPPPAGWLDRAKEYTAAYGRAGVGGNDFETSGAILQAGVQISIPLASTKERREHAQRMVEETRALQELQGKVLAEMGALRQQEADLTAVETRFGFYKKKSEWLQKREKEGLTDYEQIWSNSQQINEEDAAAKRLRTLVASQRYQLASYAGTRWKKLLAYLAGTGDLD
jgi:hypothetical protein